MFKITEGKYVDLVVEASCAEIAINAGVRLLRAQGRMCVIRLPAKIQNNVEWLTPTKKALNPVFNHSSSFWSWNIVKPMLDRKAIDAESLITATNL